MDNSLLFKFSIIKFSKFSILTLVLYLRFILDCYEFNKFLMRIIKLDFNIWLCFKLVLILDRTLRPL